MGNKSSLMLQDEEIGQISEETGFSAAEIEKLYSRFAILDRANCGSLSKNDLLSIPELAINPLCDRLIQLFFAECDPDDDRVNFRQFVKVLATFRPNGTNHNRHGSNSRNKIVNANDESVRNIGNDSRHSTSNLAENPSDGLKNKLLFIFKVYDADGDGRISFDDLRAILRMMVGNYVENSQLDKIATRVFAELDDDKDGFIEFKDFCQVFSAKDLNNKLRVKFVR